MHYTSRLSLFDIDQTLTEFCPRTSNFHGNFSFPDIVWINFAYIEMEFGMVVYNEKLQINMSFVFIDLNLTELLYPWVSNFHGNFSFPDIIFKNNFADIKTKSGVIVYNKV
jgi:hypothetical protein